MYFASFPGESLDTSYLTPYLEPLGPNFRNGVNFAFSGAATQPRYRPFSLDVQILQFLRFRARSPELISKGTITLSYKKLNFFIHKLVPRRIYLLNIVMLALLIAFILGYKDFVNDEAFKDALHIIDIGQNDLAGSFEHLSYEQVIKNIPSLITEINYAIQVNLSFLTSMLKINTNFLVLYFHILHVF